MSNSTLTFVKYNSAAYQLINTHRKVQGAYFGHGRGFRKILHHDVFSSQYEFRYAIVLEG